METNSTRDRRKRSLFRRVIRCWLLALVACGTAFLLLIILLPLDAASSENRLIGPTNDLPAYVSKVEIAENIVVRHFAKQEAGITGHYKGYLLLKLCLLHGEAVLSRPYCGRSRSWIGGTPGKLGIFGFVQSPTHWANIDNDAVMWRPSWSEPVILEMVTEDGMGGNCGIAWLAFGILSCQPKTIKNRPDIGAELAVLRISRNNSLGNPYDHYYSSDYRIESNKSDRPYLAIGLMFITCGLLFVLSNILVTKAVKRSYDPICLCLAWLGGFVSIAVPTLWIIWH